MDDAWLKSILVATDLGHEAEAALSRAARLPLARGATVTILHVVDPGVDACDGRRTVESLSRTLAALRRLLGADPIEVLSATDEGGAAVEIAEHARAAAADLIVIGHHHASWIERLIHSTADRVLRETMIPLLVVVRPPEDSYRSLVHAYDLEQTSHAALSLALRLTGRLPNATIVHAWEAPPHLYLEPVPLQDRETTRRRLAENARQVIASNLATLGTTTDWTVVVREGKPGPTVVDEATRRQADLLSMGTLARRGVGRALFGSVAAHVLRHAPCDLLIARP